MQYPLQATAGATRTRPVNHRAPPPPGRRDRARAWLHGLRALNWSGKKHQRGPLEVLAWVGFTVFPAITAIGIASWFVGGTDGVLWAASTCNSNSLGCNAVIEFFGAAFAVALGSVIFRRWQITRDIGSYLARARDEPWRLLPGAAPIDRIVGRTGICNIIEKELAEKERYRPQVIVAGAGDGKTAVLLALTKLLSERGAVPVPVRLRDAQGEFDLVGLAKDCFAEQVGLRLSADEGERTWKHLCHDRLIVILADGLEEAALRAEEDRLRAISLAIDRAQDAGIPLVVTSRPDEVLEAIDVAIIRLEPLPTRSVVKYIGGVREDVDKDENEDALIEELAQTAVLMERPLYLKLARDLYRHGRLADFPVKEGRLTARFELLQRWRKWLLDSADSELRVHGRDRELALRGAELMACVAMAENKLEVDVRGLEDSPYVPDRELADLPDPAVVARIADHLDVVELIGDKIRFRHSILQAYLGSRHLPALLHDGDKEASNGAREAPGYLDEALRNPGRELLMALVMCCFAREDRDLAGTVRNRLLEAATSTSSHAAFELVAAAYEVDARVTGMGGEKLRHAAEGTWHSAAADRRNVETTEAKLRVILPMEEAGRCGDATAYAAQWEICRAEDAYAVRFQAAQSLAGGGSDALAVVEKDLARVRACAEQALVHANGEVPEPPWTDVRDCIVLAWMMPLLAATCKEHDATRVLEDIGDLIRLVGGGAPGQPRLHLAVEAAIAQGFKWEANRRLGEGDDRTRNALIDRANELLTASHWWHSQVMLLQALALWAHEADSQRKAQLTGRIAAHRLWPRHPFVREAAALCAKAINADLARRSDPDERRRGPSRHIWIDEVGVAAKIGPRRLPSDSKLWIPPAAGWHALDPRARQLVGDTLVFLNLIEGGEAPAAEPADAARTGRSAERERRRRRVHAQGPALPECLTRSEDRALLLAEARCDEAADVMSPSCPDGRCAFGLCPYSKGADRPFRGELTETFCREQQRLVKRPRRRLPRWERSWSLFGRQVVPTGREYRQLNDFWTRMEARDQGL